MNANNETQAITQAIILAEKVGATIKFSAVGGEFPNPFNFPAEDAVRLMDQKDYSPSDEIPTLITKDEIILSPKACKLVVGPQKLVPLFYIGPWRKNYSMAWIENLLLETEKDVGENFEVELKIRKITQNESSI